VLARRTLAALGLLLFPLGVSAEDAQSFFPLDQGDRWSYDRVDAWGNHDNVDAQVLAANASVQLSNGPFGARWVSLQGPLATLTDASNGVTSIDFSNAARSEIVTTPAGVFAGCTRVDFAPSPAAVNIESVWFAPGVGVVQWTESRWDGEAIATVVSARVGTRVLPATATPRTYPLSFLDSSPYIDLSFTGVSAPATFLFDTGANVSGIDGVWLSTSGVSWHSGLSTSAGGTTGNLYVSTAILDRLDLGNGFFANPSFLIEDFTHFISPAGKTQVGLLGTDFISCYAVTLDYANQQVTLALPSERGAPPAFGTAVPVTYPFRLPTVPVTLGSVSVSCRLDTGDSYADSRPLLDVNQRTVDALGASGVTFHSAGWITVAGVSGQENLSLLEADLGLALGLGGASIPGIVLVVHDQGTLAQEPSAVALAGSSLLARFGSLTLDPFDKKLWIGK
jgi:hypothetical protein